MSRSKKRKNNKKEERLPEATMGGALHFLKVVAYSLGLLTTVGLLGTAIGTYGFRLLKDADSPRWASNVCMLVTVLISIAAAKGIDSWVSKRFSTFRNDKPLI